MDTLTDLAGGLLAGLAYSVVGIILLVLGFIAVDLVTPGRLRDVVYTDRNVNAALVLASGLIAIGTIVTTAIITSDDDLADGLTTTAGYGGLGVVLLGLSFLLVDRLTPGDLGAICTDDRLHPAVYVTIASHLVVGAIVAASIS